MYSLETLSDINFELSSHCNSKCPQCPRYDMLGRVHKDLNVTHLDVNVIKKLPIEKMRNLKKVSFCGNFGDPLMHPDLDEVIDFFQQQQIAISTNASLRSRQWWSDLGEKENVSVTFCIDGIGKTHELYRRNTSYDKIIKNAKAFIDAGGTARWQFIVFKHNEHQLNEAKKLSQELGFKSIKFMYSDRFDTNNKWKVYDNNEYLYDLEKSSHQTTLRESLNAPEGEKYWKLLNKNKGAISCVWSEERRLYIHSDGTVYPCCMLGSVQSGKDIEKLMLKKLVKDFKQIDLHHMNFEQILMSDIFQTTLPTSFKGDPFSHPICIEYCNKATGKYYFNNKVPTNIH
jgi:MoaA/NifB/PqqE/SkfB family radical SAM enzyme